MKYANPADMPPRPESEQLEFFDQALAASEQAFAQTGLVQHDLVVAGKRIRLKFAGDAMALQSLRALLPMCEPVMGQPDAQFLVWDSASSQTAMPAPPLSNLCFTQRGDLWTFRSLRVRSAFHYWDYSLNLFDSERRIGIFWVQDAAKLPSWTKAAPFRTLFHWFFASQGLQLIHGAAVGSGDDGILICGPGGAGKSTSALMALAAGMNFVGDDYVVLSEDGPPEAPLRAHALYATAKVHFADAHLFLAKGYTIDENEAQVPDDKAVIYPSADGLSRTLQIRAIVTPRFGTSAETEFEWHDPDAVVAAASFPSRTQLPHSGREAIAFMERAVSRLPHGRIVLGTARDRVHHALRRLLQAPQSLLSRSRRVTEAPLVSVVIPAYNAEVFIKQALDSVLAQSHPLMEIIVVDDGSRDDTASVVAGFGSKVQLVRQENAGPAAARNRGLAAATGEFVAFLDADDLWPRSKLCAALMAFRDWPECDVILGHSQLFEAGSDETDLQFIAGPLDTFPWSISAALFRRSIFDRVGEFDVNLRFGEDTDWFERAKDLQTEIRRISDIGLLVRRHSENSTRDKRVQDIYPVRLVHKRLMKQRQMASGSSRRNLENAPQQ